LCLIQHIVHIHTKLHYKITQHKDSTNELITPYTQERRTRRHNPGGKRKSMVTYYLLKVYTLMCNTFIVVYHLFLVNMHEAVTV